MANQSKKTTYEQWWTLACDMEERLRTSARTKVPGRKFRQRPRNPPDPQENTERVPGIFQVRMGVRRPGWLGYLLPRRWTTLVALSQHLYDGPSIQCATHPDYPWVNEAIRPHLEEFARQHGASALIVKMT